MDSPNLFFLQILIYTKNFVKIFSFYEIITEKITQRLCLIDIYDINQLYIQYDFFF